MDRKPVVLTAWRAGVFLTWLGHVQARGGYILHLWGTVELTRMPASPLPSGAAPFSAGPWREVRNFPEAMQGPAPLLLLVLRCLALYAPVFWGQIESGYLCKLLWGN